MSGGTGVTVTGGTGEGSTPSIAIGQAVATTDDVTFNIITASEEFIGDLEGGIRFNAKADGALSKGDVVYISGVSGDVATVGQAKADDASKMPAFGLALSDANDNAALQVVTFGTIEELDTSGVSEGQILYVSTTAGAYTTTAPTGESSQIQNIGKVIRSHASAGSIKVGGAGRSNATPNLDDGKIFIGNASNQAVTTTLDTSIVVENTNLYYTTTRANTDFDTRLATKDTGDLTEGSNLYYTTARVNSDFDTRLATKSTTDLAEGTNLYYTTARFDSAFTSKDTDDLSEGTTNLYYTTARFDSAFGNKTTADLTENTNLYYTDTRANSAIDARVTKAFVDALGIQASSVDANSVTLGTDTVGNYIQTITGTANKITVTGSGSESADVTLTLPDDVQIADSLTVAGNLTVNGTLTSLDTTNLDIEDNLFQLNAGLTGSPVNDSGMLINRGTADNGIFMWDESVDKFTLGLTTADGTATGNITLNSLGTLVANIEGNVTGAVTGTVSSLSNHDTDDLAEGSNLYYTQARFDSAFTAKSTSDLSEGSNLYYTDARFDTRLATKDTDDVSEGTSNLYYTTARFDSAFGGKSTSDLSEGTNLYYTDARVQAVSINNVVEDTTPQLGGNLDLNSSDITGTGDINITGTITSSGNITGSTGSFTRLDINATNTQLKGDLFAHTDAAYDIGASGANRPRNLYLSNSINAADITTTGAANVGSLTVDTSTLVVDASNNRVGIGTTSPAGSGLHIRKDTSATTNELLRLSNSAGSTTDGVKIVMEVANTSGNGGEIGVVRDGGSFNPYMFFSTSSGVGSSPTERMRIASDGKVGISTTSAKEKLDVSGAAVFTGSHATGTNAYGAAQGVMIHATSSTGFVTAVSNGANDVDLQLRGLNGGNANANQLVLDSTGNVGIGTDSPAYITEIAKSQAGGVGPTLYLHNTADNSAVGHAAEIRFNLRNAEATTRNAAIQAVAEGTYGTSPSLTFLTSSGDNGSATERMRIDSAGRVMIAETSNSGYSANADDLIIGDNGSATERGISIGATSGGSIRWNDGADAGSIEYAHSDNSMRLHTAGAERLRITSSGVVDIKSGGTASAPSLIFEGDTNTGLFHGGDTLGFSTAGAERMRIDSSGNLLVGATSTTSTDNGVKLFGQSGSLLGSMSLSKTYSSGTITYVYFERDSGSVVGSISYNGSATAYNTSSDARLKDVTGEARGLEVINELNPVSYNWKADGKADEGLIAQEVQEIVPNAVTGSEEEYYQMDYSKLVVHLVKGMKEQQAQIEALQSEINLLKGE